MNQLPRDVQKWLQNIGLSVNIRNVKWDLADGRAVAEILHIHFPDANIKLLVNSRRSAERQRNWQILEKTIKSLNLDCSRHLLEGTMNAMNDAGTMLLKCLYEQLLQKKVTTIKRIKNSDFTDFNYQKTIPFSARPTMSYSVKSNLKAYYTTVSLTSSRNKKKRVEIITRHYSHYKNWVKSHPKYPRSPAHLYEKTRRMIPKPSINEDLLVAADSLPRSSLSLPGSPMSVHHLTVGS